MADDIITIIWEHVCECARNGQQVRETPTCRDGAYFASTPICIETGLGLRKVEERKA